MKHAGLRHGFSQPGANLIAKDANGIFVAGVNFVAERAAGVFVSGANLFADRRKLTMHLISELRNLQCQGINACGEFL